MRKLCRYKLKRLPSPIYYLERTPNAHLIKYNKMRLRMIDKAYKVVIRNIMKRYNQEGKMNSEV